MAHKTTLFSTFLVAACISAAVAPSVRLSAGQAGCCRRRRRPAAPVEFVRDIQPILDAQCYECHGTKKARGQLRLDRKSSVFTGGMSGPAVAPGDSENSVLVRRLLGLDGEDRMPLDKDPLSDAQIALIRRWIDQGATVAGHGRRDRRRHCPPRRHSTGPTSGRCGTRRRPFATRPGHARRSTASSSRGWRPKAWRHPRKRRRNGCCAACPWTSSACRPQPQELDAFVADTRTGRIRASRRSPPGLAALRRAVGASVARPRALRRLERLREGRAAHDVEVPRLGHRRAQSRHAVRPVHGRAARRRHAAERDAGTARRDRVPSQHAAQPGRAASTSRKRAGRPSSIASTRPAPSGSDPRSRCAQCHNHKYDPFSQQDYYRLLAFFDNGDYNVRDSRAAITGLRSRSSICRRRNRRRSARRCRRSSTR